MKFETAKTKYGSVNCGHGEIALTQAAYITQDDIYDGAYYRASGIDENGNDYKVSWEIRSGVDIDRLEDESEACDWDRPMCVAKL